MSSEPKIHKGSERLILKFRITGQPVIDGQDGKVTVTDIVFTDYGDKANLTASGLKVGGSWKNQVRSVRFNVHGYPYPPPPPWMDKLFNEALEKYMGGQS